MDPVLEQELLAAELGIAPPEMGLGQAEMGLAPPEMGMGGMGMMDPQIEAALNQSTYDMIAAQEAQQATMEGIIAGGPGLAAPVNDPNFPQVESQIAQNNETASLNAADSFDAYIRE